MSGQSSIALEQQPAAEQSERDPKPIQIERVDPIAAFLEKHGSAMVQNHEGQTVTAAEAVANCPPFARLVSVMGEAALGLAAPKQVKEEKLKKTETEEETEEKTEEEVDEPEPQVKESEMPKTDDGEDQETHTVDSIDGASNIAESAEPAKTDNSDAKTEVPTTSKTEDSQETAQIAPSHESVTKPYTETTMESSSGEISGGSQDFKGYAMGDSKSGEPQGHAHTPLEIKNPEPKAENIVEESAVKPAAPAIKTEIIAEDNDREIFVSATGDGSAAAESEKEVLEVEESGETHSIDADTLEDEESIPNPEMPEDQTRDDEPDIELLEAPSEEADFETATLPPTEEVAEEVILPADEQGLDSEYETPPSERVVQVEATPAPATENSPIIESQEYTAQPEAVSLSLPIQEVNLAITEVQERIETLEIEEIEIVHQQLDRIMHNVEEVHVPAATTEETSETLKADVVKEELEGLFTELLERLEIDYTPELAESFATLALRGDLSEIIKLNDNDENTDPPTDRGTHEIIKHLLAAVAKVKQTAENAYRLGQSVMKLYTQQFAN